MTSPDPQPRSRLERYQPFLTLVLILAIVGGAAVFALRRPAPTAMTIIPPPPTSTPAPSATPEPSATPGPIEVYVTGAVGNPGVLVTIPYESRARDAIDMAGGLTEDADLERVNLAQILRDGDQVHVFSVNDVIAGEGEVVLATPSDAGIVYINSASAEELDVLPGVGPALASRIIAYREENGPFASLEDLDNVSGIGPSTLEAIAPMVSFEMR
jgi:competence protein ComEA